MDATPGSSFLRGGPLGGKTAACTPGVDMIEGGRDAARERRPAEVMLEVDTDCLPVCMEARITVLLEGFMFGSDALVKVRV